MSYKLRSNLVGHGADVKFVSPSLFPEGGVLTASRDLSCRLWSPVEGSTTEFFEAHIFQGHSRYVATVTTLPPSEHHPQGLVATGGYDNLVLVFDFSSLEPIQRLEGHTGTVCSLDAGKFGTIMSGSWDKTARIWVNGKTVMTFSDHEAAVWSVKMMPDRGLMLTGSADKTIKLWKAGRCERTYTGHKDCVRSLAILSNDEFLSSSNDGTIRRWTLDGNCLRIFEGHNSFVYSISVIPNSNGAFVSSGEDRCIKVWKDDECHQTIMLPCQSVWSVNCLGNGDIVCGGSDGIARIFTHEESRKASEEVLKEFEETVANQAIPLASSLDLGEIKIDQLPGPEALLRPGTKKDQTKLIKRNGIIEAHQWDDINGSWQKVGEVTGAAGEEGSKRKEGKELFEGKEYDYVFNVDIEEGKPPLKLPFNVTDDPWMAAQTFLERNNISQMFLDQVANFVIKNTEGMTIGPAEPDLSDPFTGSSRYVPSSETPSQNQAGSDPFTGASRFIPETTPNSSSSTFSGASADSSSITYFPERNVLRFASGKSEQIISKLKDFNQSADMQTKLTDTEIQTLTGITSDILNSKNGILEDNYLTALSALEKLGEWPPETHIPVLDILRILVLNARFSREHIFNESHAERFINKLTTVARNAQPLLLRMLAYRILTNSFSQHSAASFVYSHREKFLDCCVNLYSTNHKNLGIAVSSFVVNCSVYCRNQNGSFEDKVRLCTYIDKFLQSNNENESIFRLLVSLGTLLTDNDDLIAFAQSLDINNTLKPLMEKTDAEKVKLCAKRLLQILS